MTTAYIGVGSNINPKENILKALYLLIEKTPVTATSMFYYTEPLRQKSQPVYCNGVWKILCGFTPYILKFDVLRRIESEVGRIRGNDKYASRTVDLDIIIYGKKVIKTEDMVIPDPDIYKRPFISIPVFEITPDLVLPDTGKSIKEIAMGMKDKQMKPAYDITNLIKKGIKYE